MEKVGFAVVEKREKRRSANTMGITQDKVYAAPNQDLVSIMSQSSDTAPPDFIKRLMGAAVHILKSEDELVCIKEANIMCFSSVASEAGPRCPRFRKTIGLVQREVVFAAERRKEVTLKLCPHRQSYYPKFEGASEDPGTKEIQDSLPAAQERSLRRP